MTHAQTSKFTLYTLLLALFILAACGGAKLSSTAGGNGTPRGNVDCTAKGNSFNAACRNEPAAITARLELCGGRIADLTDAGGSAAACNTAALSGTICGTGSAPGTNPYAPICSEPVAVPNDFDVTLAQTTFSNACKTSPFTRGCRNAPDNERSVTTYCTPGKFFREGCSIEVNVNCTAEGVCTPNPAYLARMTARLNACASYAGDASALMAADGTVASCNSPELAGVICGTATTIGTNPFATICSESTGNSDSANIEDRQLAYCSENRTTNTCPTVISTFCGTADGAKSQSLCPSQYAAATTVPAIVTAVASKSKARNIADTAEATILNEITGGAYTSYVDAIAGTAVGGITRPTFNFGGAAHGVGDVSIIQEGLLLSELVFKESNDDTHTKLPNVANDEGTELANIGNTDGFAIARVDNPAFTDNPDGSIDKRARFYAGLLTTTDLGAPLTDSSADGIWTAEFVAIVSDSNSEGRSGRRIATRSTLRVSFADKTIQTREVGGRFTPIAPSASFSNPRPSNPTDFFDGISTENNDAGRPYNIAGSRITIDGRFNAEGVISGASSWIYDGKTSRGSVSGLIGIEGAVGTFVSNGRNNGEDSNGEYAGGFVASNECAIIPFHASCADRHFQGLRAARIEFCKDGTQSANPLCMQAAVTAITTPCAADPFASACSLYEAQYETERNTRLDICRGDNHASVDCTTNARRTVCSYLYYPYAPLCSDNYDNTVDEDNYCRYTNPFDKTNCIDGKANNEVIERQRLFCSGREFGENDNAQNTPFYDGCTRTIQGFCGTETVLPEPISNLFSSTCSGDNFNVARGRACLDGYTDNLGMTPTSCGDETTADKDIYAYCDSDAGLTNARDCPVAYARKNPVVSTVSLADFAGTGENQLLKSDASGALTGVVASGGASLANTNTSFITGDADGLDLGLADNKTVGRRTLRLFELGTNNNTTSGFAMATGLIDSAGTDVTKHYVGLLSGTNLGAPLSHAAHSGTWDAKIHIRTGKINALNPFTAGLNLDFKLKVDFATKTIKIVTAQDVATTITFAESDYEVGPVTISGGRPNPVFSITNGKFTDNGVIYGTTNLLASFRNSPGTLTGLIGQDGAVGIFKSDNDDGFNFDYVGGFIAAPVAPDPAGTEDFTNWEASFDTDGVNESQTLQDVGFSSSTTITAEYIKLDKSNKIVVHGAPLDTTILRLNETPGQNGYESGFAYASHSGTGTKSLYLAQAYVGLLSTTDVGVPLPLSTYSTVPTNVVWTGRIAGTFGDTDFSNDNFQLNISYGAVGSAGVGKITTPIYGDRYYHGGNFKYYSTPILLSAPAGGRNSIAINGTFNSSGVISGSVTFNSNAGSTANGTLTGLIGQSGAVAVFNGVVRNLYTAFFRTPYAGGFAIAPKSCIVAGNCVVFETWKNSFGATGANEDNTLRNPGYEAPAEAAGTAFVEYTTVGRANRINAIPIIIPDGNKAGDTATAKTLRLNNIHEGGYESGVVYAHEFDTSVSPSIAQIYAAMLPTTNLGAPLTDVSQNGTWTGTLEGYDGAGNSINDTTFALNVTFTTAGGTIASDPADIMLTEGGFGITFNGTFNNIGVIAGTTAGSSGNSATGTFSGLIAEKGAVGVFRGIDANDVRGGYGGGFVVCPYGDADSRCQR